MCEMKRIGRNETKRHLRKAYNIHFSFCSDMCVLCEVFVYIFVIYVCLEEHLKRHPGGCVVAYLHYSSLLRK